MVRARGVTSGWDAAEVDDALRALCMRHRKRLLANINLRKVARRDGTVGWDRTSDLRIHNPAL